MPTISYPEHIGDFDDDILQVALNIPVSVYNVSATMPLFCFRSQAETLLESAVLLLKFLTVMKLFQ